MKDKDDKKIIITVVGLNAAGKDTVADYLKEKKGFIPISLSDRIREECMKRGTKRENITVPMLIEVGIELRKEFGNSVLAKRSLKKISIKGENRFIFTSLRHPDEVKYLKSKSKNFYLFEVWAPIKLRYERSQLRKKPEDRMSFEEFKAQEERQLRGSGPEQQLNAVIKMADFRIDNSGNESILKRRVRQIIESINTGSLQG